MPPQTIMPAGRLTLAAAGDDDVQALQLRVKQSTGAATLARGLLFFTERLVRKGKTALCELMFRAARARIFSEET